MNISCFLMWPSRGIGALILSALLLIPLPAQGDPTRAMPGLGGVTQARPKPGSGNTNPLDPRTNRTYGQMTQRVRSLFSELTLLPENAFDVVWLPESDPETLAAMSSDSRRSVSLGGRSNNLKIKPVLYVSEALLHEVKSDDQLEGVLLHEFGHQLQDAEFKKWAIEKQQEYLKQQKGVDSRTALQTIVAMDITSRDIQEHGADVIAQYHLLLRRRSPQALLELFEKWLAQNQGGKKYRGNKGIAGYFLRTHPDPAERIRVLSAFNSYMEGNPDVYPVELRNQPQTVSTLKALLDETQTQAYRAAVLDDFKDRLQRFHRKRIQSIPPLPTREIWKLDPEDSLSEPDPPSIPLHPALQAQAKALLKDALDQSLEAFVAELSNRIESALAADLTIDERIKLYRSARVTLEGLDRWVSDSTGGSGADQERLQDLVENARGYKKLDKLIAQTERRLLVEADQLFKGQHRSSLSNRNNRPGHIEKTVHEILRVLPDEAATKWLTTLPRRIRSESAGRDAHTALEILHPDEPWKVYRTINEDTYLELLDEFLARDPGYAVGHLASFWNSFTEESSRWNLTPERAQRLQKIVSTALKAAPPKAYDSVDIRAFFTAAKARGIAVDAFAAPLAARIEEAWTRESLLLRDRSITHYWELFAIYRDVPELRPMLRGTLDTLLDLHHSALQGAADSKGQDKLDAKLSAPGRALFNRLLEDPELGAGLEAFSKLQSYWNDQLPSQVSTLLKEDSATLKALMRRALADLDLKGDLATLKKSAHEQQPSGNKVAILQLALLQPEQFPELTQRILPLKKSVLADYFRINALGNRVQERERRGRSRSAMLVFRKLFPDQLERAAVLKEGLERNFSHFRLADYLAVFGMPLTLQEIAALNVPADRQVEILDHFQAGRLTQDADIHWLRAIQAKAADELKEGRTSFSAFLNTVQNLRGHLPSNFSPEAVAFYEDMDRHVQGHIERLQSLPPQARYDGLKDALLGISKNGTSRRRTDDRYARAERAKEALETERLGTQKVVEDALLKSVDPGDYAKRVELFSLGLANGIERFTRPESVQSLLDDLLRAPLTHHQRLEWISRIRPRLGRVRTEKAWEQLSQGLYAKPYSEKDAIYLIRALFGDQADQVDRKMNEVFHRYKLGEKPMASLRDRLFPKDEIAGLVGIGKLLKAAIRVNMDSDPAAGVELFRWLHGKSENPPPMARGIESTLKAVASGSEIYGSNISNHWDSLEYSTAQRLAKTLTLEEIRDVYQRNNALFRMVLTADLLNPLLAESITHTEAGRELLVDYVVEGMDVRNVEIAKAHLSAYLAANDQPGDNFLDQILASSVRTDEVQSDAVKVRDTMRAKGGLWVKMGQQAYADRLVIQDEEVREVFAQVLDHANDPTRPEKYKLLKEAMGDEYVKVKQIHETLGSGSINATFIVELIDGKHYVARLVQGHPEAAANHERLRLAKTSQLLKEKAQSSPDPAFREKLQRVALAIDEYIPVLADKMRFETDLSRERALEKMLKDSYKKSYSDLGVEIDLITEAETIVRFDRDGSQAGAEGKKAANSKRLVLYPLIDKLNWDDLTPQESERVRHAIQRAEWEALFKKNQVWDAHTFDPDGHKQNWLFTRDPHNAGIIRLVRIDFSQGEALPPEKVEHLKKLVGHVFSKQHPVLGARHGLPAEQAFSHMRGLVEARGIDEAALAKGFHSAFHNALRDKPSADPITIVSDIQAQLKLQFGEGLSFNPGIVMAIKSLMTTQQHLLPNSARDRAFQAEQFARLVLEAPKPFQKVSSWLAGTQTWGRNLWEEVKKKSAGLLRDQPQSDQHAIERADALVKVVESRTGRSLGHKDIEGLIGLYDLVPSRQGAIMQALQNHYLSLSGKDYKQEGSNDLLFEFFEQRLQEADFRDLIGRALPLAEEQKALSLLRHISAKQWDSLYPEVAELLWKSRTTLRNFHESQFFEKVLPHNPALRLAFIRVAQGHLKNAPVSALRAFDRARFPELWSDIGTRLDRAQSAGDIFDALQAQNKLRPEEMRQLSRQLLPELRQAAAMEPGALLERYQKDELPSLAAAHRFTRSGRAVGWGDGEVFDLSQQITQKLLSVAPSQGLKGLDSELLQYHPPSAEDSDAILRDFALYARNREVAERALDVLAVRESPQAREFLGQVSQAAHLAQVRATALNRKGPHKEIAPGVILYKQGQDYKVALSGGPPRQARYGRKYLDALWREGVKDLKREVLNRVLGSLDTLSAFVALHSGERPGTNNAGLSGIEPGGLISALERDFSAGQTVSREDLRGLHKTAADLRWSVNEAGYQAVASAVDFLLHQDLPDEHHAQLRKTIRLIPPEFNAELNQQLLSPAMAARRNTLPIEKIWSVLNQERNVYSPRMKSVLAENILSASDLDVFGRLMDEKDGLEKIQLTTALATELRFESPEVFARWRDTVLAGFERGRLHGSNYVVSFNPAEEERLRQALATAEKQFEPTCDQALAALSGR